MWLFGRRGRIYANLRVGKPDVKPSTPSHVAGVREGNQPVRKERGLHPDPDDQRLMRASAARSTGINPKAHEPIDPRMPNLPPS